MPMCRRTSKMRGPDRGPSSMRPQLLTISNMAGEAVAKADAKSRKAEPNHHRTEQIRSFNGTPCFVQMALWLLSRRR